MTRTLPLVVALLGGLVVFVFASDLFAYHSVNDDEGVYLLQAAMLLDGHLFLRPGEFGLAVRPWFFVVDETAAVADAGAVGGPGSADLRLYSKYSPGAPAMFALGKLVGDAHLALAGVACGTTYFTYRLTADFTDRVTGLVAGLLLVGTPLFLLTSSVFLSYAPATVLNLAFAVCYVRAVRHRHRGWALAAGVAVGLAFFTRQYTAVLFALPFVSHRCWALWRAWRVRRGGRSSADAGGGAGNDRFRETLVLSLAIAVPGLAFVALTLGYNAVVTGDALTFPYKAFGPEDGIGFGERELLGYDRNYTPALAASATLAALAELGGEWTVAAPLGTGLALVGAGWFLLRDVVRARRGPGRLGESVGGDETVGDHLPAETLGLLLLGLVPTVVLGNAYFWGTLNGLTNGLIDLLGPYYHFDLLLPLSAFGAVALVRGWRGLRSALYTRYDRRTATAGLLAVLLVSAPVLAVAESRAVGDPVAENRLRTENLATTYEPIRETDFDRAVVLTADPYGDWQQHPFQYLRNDPGFDGPVVYATEDDPERDLRVLTATNRTPYRFTYQGDWTGATTPVESTLQRLRVVSGESVSAETTLGVPDGMRAVSIRLASDDGSARYETLRVGDGSNGTGSVGDTNAITVRWQVTPESVRVTNVPPATDPGSVGVPTPAGASEVDLIVTFVDGAGGSVTYRQTVTVGTQAATDGETERSVQVVWPPETVVCELTTDCGSEERWVGPEGDYPDGVGVATNATATA
nr:glycosyltransferase family 39 protein [Salinirubrum litoreum]